MGRVRSRGVEFEATFRPVRDLLFSGSYSFDDAVLRDTEDPALAGKRVRQVPRHQFVLRTSFDRPSLFACSVQTRYVGERFEDDVNSLPLKDLLVVDVLVSRSVLRWAEVFGSVENVFDFEYDVRASTNGLLEISAPRLIQAGMRLNF